MSAVGNKIRKKSPNTPGKGQQTLSSFLTKRSSNLGEKSVANNVSRASEGPAESQSDKEAGKKRKLGQSSLANNSNQPKSKKSNIGNSSNVTKQDNAKYELKNIPNTESKNRELGSKFHADCSLENGRQLLNNSICDKSDIDLFDDTKLGEDVSLKENSIDEQIFKKRSSPESNSSKIEDSNSVSPKAYNKSKGFTPLKTVSQNVPLPSIKRDKDILQDESQSSKQEDLLNSLLSNCKNDGGISSSENMETDVSGPKEEACGSLEDDFLFEAFDKPFKSEDEVDKSNKGSGCHSQSHCSNITDDFDNIFSDDWNGDTLADVDLSTLQRCKVENISRDKFMNLIVDVLHVESHIPVTVTFMGFWREVRLQQDDFINIQATKQGSSWIVDNNNGFVIEQPDFLVSGTSVVGALFCARRGVLSDRFKGIESVTDCKQGSSVMVIGSLVHELLQEVLKKQIYTKPGIAKLLKNLLNSQNTASMLYSASMSSETCEKEMLPFVPKIFHFIERYVKDKTSRHTDDNFNGKINVVRDIEENLWVPQLGIKGKVDVTVEVNVNLRPRIMPLELKTGRASFSLEHRGQVILYTMMMAVTGQDVEAGLLLYLRENIMREIKVGHPERRDLILLRNNLAYYLTRKVELTSKVDSGLDSEFQMESMELPEPINHRACQSCPYSALCCAYLKNDKNYKLNDRHQLTPIMKELDNYLKPEHIDYVMKWVKMLRINETDQVEAVQPLKLIWTVPPTEREKKGKCLSNLKIIGRVIEESKRYRHTFSRVDLAHSELTQDFTKSGFALLEYIIVSTTTKFNVCAGPIIELTKNSLSVLLERNLAGQKPNEIYHIDGYTSSQTVLIINLSNVGYLLDDNTVTERMRKIVIERAPATFLKKLDRTLAAVAAQILKPLNKTQQKAVLKVLAANEYLLIKGMPGSGKTLTLVAIIELLVKLGKSVLLTAHTHSAVDNVLLKLMETGVDFIRLGSTNKIHPSLLSKSESVLTQECYTPESLDAAYNSKNVVCVTCLGANHPLLGRRMFDVCLVDESTQVLQSSVLRPLYSASKFVLIGDPNQLPPVVTSDAARELGMDQSLFERLDTENNTITLASQYRMNERIMYIANQVTYNGQLTVGTDEIGSATLNIPDKLMLNSCQQWVREALSTDLDNSVILLDTGDKFNILKNDAGSATDDYHAERRCSNLCEVAVILHLVTTLIQAGVLADRIGVIAPYREQVNLLRATIKQDVEVNTVDQYQGRDKEIILYSGTSSASFRSDQEKNFNILDDHRRLTVAITRAKHKLVIVGNVKSLKEFIPFKKLFDEIRSKDVIVLQNGSADFMWEELLSVVKQ